MPAPFHRRKALVALVATICLLLLPASPPTAASSLPIVGAPWQGCGLSAQALDRLRADLSLDTTLANLAQSLATGLGTGQPPPADGLQSLAEDSLDGLGDASEQLEQAATEISKQLEAMDLPRQQRAWSQGVQRVRTARTNLRYVTRPGSLSGGRIGPLSATGAGARMMTEAATAAGDYGRAADALKEIAIDGEFGHVARSPGIQQGARDSNPTQNPGPDPWQEWLRRMQAQVARIRNSVGGLNAARALQGNQLQQAQQHAERMRAAIGDAQNLANQLGQMAALCSQANVNRPQSQGTPSQPQGAPNNSAPGKAASSGGGMGLGATLGLAAAGAAAAGGYYLYQQAAVCTEPSTANQNACFQGSCSACAAAIAALVPYCDCVEKKEADAAGVGSLCRQALDAMNEAVRLGCLVPANATRVPKLPRKR